MSNRRFFEIVGLSLALVACEQAPAGQTEQALEKGCGPGGAHAQDCPHKDEPDVAPAEARVEVELGDAPVLGAPNAEVTLVVFSDFECPFCDRGADVVKALQTKHGANLAIAFKQRPLPFHKSARLAAKASLAAANQDKFWEYHDALFEDQKALDREALVQRATALELDVERFVADMDSPQMEERVRADEAEADRLGVRGTPTFFLNGRKITGAQPIAVFEEAIAAARDG